MKKRKARRVVPKKGKLCYCGFIFNGKRCSELRIKHPELNNDSWHYATEGYGHD